MEAAGAAPPAPETPYRTTQQGPSHHRQRSPLAPSHRSTLAGSARTLWLLETIASRLYRWREVEFWPDILQWLQQEADAEGRAGLEPPSCGRHDHPSPPACGGSTTTKGYRASRRSIGRSQGGFSTKIHLRAEGCGKPIAFLLTAGQRHEQTEFEALMETGAVKRPDQDDPGYVQIESLETRGTAARRSGGICADEALEQSSLARSGKVGRGSIRRSIERAIWWSVS